MRTYGESLGSPTPLWGRNIMSQTHFCIFRIVFLSDCHFLFIFGCPFLSKLIKKDKPESQPCKNITECPWSFLDPPRIQKCYVERILLHFLIFGGSQRRLSFFIRVSFFIKSDEKWHSSFGTMPQPEIIPHTSFWLWFICVSFLITLGSRMFFFIVSFFIKNDKKWHSSFGIP